MHYMSVCVYVRTYVRICVCTYVCMYVCNYVFMLGATRQSFENVVSNRRFRACLAGSSSKPVALLALIIFNILEMCSTVTLTRLDILSETVCL